MNRRFARILTWVAAVHLAVLTVLCIRPLWRLLERERPEMRLPIEFVVQVPAASAAQQEPAVREEPVPPAPEPAPSPRKEIKVSRQRIVRHAAPPDPGPATLTEEEIRKRLAQGARPSDHTSIADEDTRCLALVHEALYRAWLQPGRDEAGDAVAVGAIRLAADGRVLARRLSGPSGNVLVDDSVSRALNAVRQIAGLTPGFVERHPEITVSFRVE